MNDRSLKNRNLIDNTMRNAIILNMFFNLKGKGCASEVKNEIK